MNLDPDRELQRIHSLVISNIERLDSLIGMVIFITLVLFALLAE